MVDKKIIYALIAVLLILSLACGYTYYVRFIQDTGGADSEISVSGTINDYSLEKVAGSVGVAINRDGVYDYGPSIFYDESKQKYLMYWCTPQADQTGDRIFRATSINSKTWINQASSLEVTPNSEETNGAADGHVCDPSAIKVDGKYYLYYTAAASGTADDGTNNSVFLATSTNSSTWNKYGGTATPKAVINNTVNSGGYGIGQSTVFYKDGEFWMYYTNTDKSGVMLAKSSDGKTWQNQNGGKLVIADNYNFVVTYMKDLDIFVGMALANESTNKGLYYYFSSDGVNWSAKKKVKTNSGFGATHNVGILTDESGLVSGDKLAIYYGAGESNKPATWDIYRTEYNVIVDTTGGGEEPPGSGTTIQGFVLGEDGQICSSSSCPGDWNMTLNGAEQTSENPYFYTGVVDGTHEVGLNYSGSYKAYYSLCEGCTDHSESSYVEADSLSIALASQGYVDLYWKFVPTDQTGDTGGEDTGEDIIPNIFVHEDGTVTCGNIDSNGDGKLSIIDFKAFVGVYAKSCYVPGDNSTVTREEYACGSQDTNGDGKVSIIDFVSFKKRYGIEDCSL